MSYSPRKGSVVRDFMLWLFDVPYGEPYVSCSFDVRWDPAQAWLDRVNATGGVRVTTHHLFTAAVGRLFVEFPAINARIHKNRIYSLPSVDVVMPVHVQDGANELSMMIVKGVEKLDPRGVAETMAPQVRSERSGRAADPTVKALFDAGRASPRALRLALRTVAAAAHDPRTAALLYKQFPVSTVVTNVGAAVAPMEGVRFRAASFSPPEKLVHMGSIFGLGPIERAAVVERDAIVVAPVLPIVFVFDHRLVDGVGASRIMARLGAMLLDPAALFPTT